MGSSDIGRGQRRFSRRQFLKSAGASTAGMVAAGKVTVTAASESTEQAFVEGRFGRLFRLAPFAEPTPELEAALMDIGRPGGILDAGDALDRGPVDLIIDPELSEDNRNNPTHTAGMTFVGQFLDHDITFDFGSRLGTPTAPEASINGRTPAFDLDSVYGGGPVANSHLYDPTDPAKLRVESGGLFEDLPRTVDNRAIIGDPRNDEHLIIAGLHAGFLHFHNRVVDHVRSEMELSNPTEVYETARRIVTWHYHWIIVHEVLPSFVGEAMVDDILNNGRRFYTPALGEAFIPVKFQGAAYRFGHSMVRPSYRANLAGDDGNPFFGMIFDPSQENLDDPDDLRGGCRAPRRFVGWQTFFDFGDGEVRPNKRIDTKISSPLFNLPLAAIPSRDLPTALAQRTLLRHITWLLPSGQSIAQQMGVSPLSPQELAELTDYGLGLEERTPLWYYVLKEAEVRADGKHLGPVGGRIVSEVFIGLLESDPNSYLVMEPSWKPTLPTAISGDFTMVDLLTFAGLDPISGDSSRKLMMSSWYRPRSSSRYMTRLPLGFGVGSSTSSEIPTVPCTDQKGVNLGRQGLTRICVLTKIVAPKGNSHARAPYLRDIRYSRRCNHYSRPIKNCRWPGLQF